MKDDSDSESVETIAKRLAARGEDALVARLRDAFAQAAAKHADLVSVTEAQLEELVQRSAEHADGLQWRLALADVACEELGIGRIEALQHPAVTRAQELVGAPSYEESLAELAARPGGGGGEPATAAAGIPEKWEDPELEYAEADDYEGELDVDELDADETRRLHLTAIHLGGVESLPAPTDLELVISSHGLDIVKGEDEVLGRLGWSEIDGLDVPALRGRQRRRAQGARLVVRTRNGDATFEVPGFSSDDLREQVDRLFHRFVRRRRLSE